MYQIYSSFDSSRYDCVLFMSLIMLNSESFAAKNVHFLSLVNPDSEILALKDYSSFDSPRYDCVLFLSLIKLNGESIAAKNVLFMSLVKGNHENLPLKDYSSFDSPRYACVLFLSLKRRIHRCEKRHTIFHKTNLPSSKAGLRPAFSSGCVGIKM